MHVKCQFYTEALGLCLLQGLNVPIIPKMAADTEDYVLQRKINLGYTYIEENLL